MSYTKELSNYVARTTFKDLPKKAIELAKLEILDTIGVAVAGYRYAYWRAKAAIDYIKEMGGRKESTILVEGLKTTCVDAAFVNSVMSHSIDFDDDNGPGHGGCIIVPTTLALGEKIETNGKEMLTAAIIGHEVGYRVRSSVMPTHYDYWHSTGTCGTFAAVAVASRLLDLDERRITDAFGMAGTESAGLLAWVGWGDFSKSLNAGKASMNGIMAALLAEKGATGPRDIFEHRSGFCRAFCREKPKFEKLSEGLGQDFTILRNLGFKYVPALSGASASMPLTVRLVKKYDIKPEEIETIYVQTYDLVMRDYMNYEPDTMLAAKLSQPYCIAIAALDREHGLDQFTEEKFKDPRIREFMRKVEIIEDPELTRRNRVTHPNSYPFIVKIRTKNGKVYGDSILTARGSVYDPLTPDDIKEKFRNNVLPSLGDVKAERIIEIIDEFEDIEKVNELTTLCCR